MSFHLHQYLNRKKEVTIVDWLMNVAAFIQPLTGVPQVYNIYSTRDSSGVSLLTWFGFMLFGAIFMAYGLAHRIRPLVIAQSLWFVVEFAVVIGIAIYG